MAAESTDKATAKTADKQDEKMTSEEKEETVVQTGGTGMQEHQADVERPQGTPTQAEAPASIATDEPQKSSGKRMAIIVVVVLLLAIGAVVAGIISGQRARKQRTEGGQEVAGAPTPTPVEEDALTTEYGEQSDSDEITAIAADLEATSFEGIDTELSDIDKELSAE